MVNSPFEPPEFYYNDTVPQVRQGAGIQQQSLQS